MDAGYFQRYLMILFRSRHIVNVRDSVRMEGHVVGESRDCSMPEVHWFRGVPHKQNIDPL